MIVIYLILKRKNIKKNLLSLSLLILPLIGSAQITITQSDLPTIGSMWFELNDTTTHQSITVGGANQTWNYSNFRRNGHLWCYFIDV